MHPFEVQGLFEFPVVVARTGRIGPRQRGAARLVEQGESRPTRRVDLRQTELTAEGVQRRGGVGIVIGVDDGNRLAGAGGGEAAEPVGLLDLLQE